MDTPQKTQTNHRIGGKKSAEKNRAKDPDFYRRIGAAGGRTTQARHRGKYGFGAFDREKHLEASRKGGRVSRRRRADD